MTSGRTFKARPSGRPAVATAAGGRRLDRAFRAIVEGTAGSTGDDFFRLLVEHLATALHVEYAFVAEALGDPPARMQTTAFWSGGRVAPEGTYDLAGTPCEGVMAGGLCFWPSGVREVFPTSRDLAALNAESYLGMPLRHGSGQVLGHIAVLDTRPMADEEHAREILRVFAARAAAEIARQRSERALMQLNAELEARVTERTAQLQAALDESSRLAAVLEATPDIVGIATFEGRLVYLNRAGREWLALAPHADVTGLQLSELYSETSFARIVSEGIPAALEHGHWSAELTVRGLAGDEIPVSLAGNVHRDAGGTPRYLSAILRDITDSRRAAAELQQAKEAAEAASRAKSAFLAAMSHEIRTPMNAVIGMTDLLLSTPLTPRQRDFVETIRAGGDALLAVINDVLDFSKIEAGRLELEARPFQLHAMFESTVDLLAPRAAEKGLELVLSIDPAVPSLVIGDEARLRQVVMNLAGNAIKFTERGEVVIAVTVGRACGDLRAGTVCEPPLLVSVRDTGIGIPPDRRDRLFASFSQLDTSTTREYGGTGLGLAISRRLVELMGGTISVDSDGVPGHGSIFQFTLCVGRVAVDGQDAHETTAGTSGAGGTLAGTRALVVDDNATNRRILALQVQRWGMLAVEAATAHEALELLRRRERFDLVLLDMQMPDMDGATLARAIGAHRGIRRLPMLLLTSLGRSAACEIEALDGVAGQLTKPVKPSQLHDAIIAALAGRPPRKGAPAGAPEAPRRTVLRAAERRLRGRARRSQPGPAGSADSTRLPAGPGRRASTVRGAASLAILLAEDMEVNRTFARLALDELGYRADEATNGEEVLRALARRRYDVVLMDVQMPEMDGLDATRRIRRDVPLDHQPYIVAMTANAMQGDRELCLEAGMDDYVSKPVYLSELDAVLARAAVWVRGARDSPRRAGVLERAAHVPIPESATILDRARVRRAGPALVQLFLREAATTLDRLRQACAAGDAGGIRQAAHQLKGSSAYLGAQRLVALATHLERLAHAGHIDAAAVHAVGDELRIVRDSAKD